MKARTVRARLTPNGLPLACTFVFSPHHRALASLLPGRPPQHDGARGSLARRPRQRRPAGELRAPRLDPRFGTCRHASLASSPCSCATPKTPGLVHCGWRACIRGRFSRHRMRSLRCLPRRCPLRTTAIGTCIGRAHRAQKPFFPPSPACASVTASSCLTSQTTMSSRART